MMHKNLHTNMHTNMHTSSSEYLYAGLGQGSNCWCGNTYDKHGEAGAMNCTTPCSGDQDEVCGGAQHLSVYEAAQPAGKCEREILVYPDRQYKYLFAIRQLKTYFDAVFRQSALFNPFSHPRHPLSASHVDPPAPVSQELEELLCCLRICLTFRSEASENPGGGETQFSIFFRSSLSRMLC